jgi:hypothetical protein
VRLLGLLPKLSVLPEAGVVEVLFHRLPVLRVAA